MTPARNAANTPEIRGRNEHLLAPLKRPNGTPRTVAPSHDPPRRRVIAYDVVSNRRRRHLEKLACSFALRIQKSVFEGELTNAQEDDFLRRAARIVDTSTDSVRVWRLCAACAENGIAYIGPPPQDELLDDFLD